jgi:hypothetical protein
MACDWIKMRTDLYRDPKVCLIAEILDSGDGQLARYVNQNTGCDMSVTRNVTRNATVGALVTVWGVMRLRGKRNGDDLVCQMATIEVLDDIADLPGFGSAMASVGWVVETETGVTFPRFFEDYNVDPAEKTPSSAAERQRRYRDRLKQALAASQGGVTRDDSVDCVSNVTRDVTLRSREEKRREEKEDKKTSSSASPNRRQNRLEDPPGFVEFWSAYPRSSGRKDAAKAWAKLAPDAAMQKIIMAAVAKQTQSDDWRSDGGKYIPHASTWINGERWNDGLFRQQPHELPEHLQGI